MESGRHVWNGDVDLGDGEVQKLRQCYEDWFKLLDAGHLTGCGAADPHNAPTSASSASLGIFPHKLENFYI